MALTIDGSSIEFPGGVTIDNGYTKIISVDTSTLEAWQKEYLSSDDLSEYREILICENGENSLNGFGAIMTMPAKMVRDGLITTYSATFKAASGGRVLIKYNTTSHSWWMSNPDSATLN